MRPWRPTTFLLALALAPTPAARAGELKAGAAAANLVADDSLVIGGWIGPRKVVGQEGELRASAVVIQDPQGRKIALVECDVLMINRDVLDDAAHRIEREAGIPFDNVLINATHTHHAPTTCSIHGYTREEAFTRQVGDKAVEAVVAANKRLTPVTMDFRLGEESSVGRNSRILLGDGQIAWGGVHEDAVRPTGPFDPELPVWAFRKPDGSLEAVMFNHSTHPLGTLKPNVRSPSFYGLAAQELEKQKGGTFLFFEGASGSTHNELPVAESITRIEAAITSALDVARPREVRSVRGLRSEFPYTVRHFDEAADDKRVVDYTTKRVKDAPTVASIIKVFRDMRTELAPHQGEGRKTWIQALRVGDIAIVGVPGECFTVLGQDIKRRSPFRDTYVFELANDYIGYIPDRKGHELGGYQTWTGLHSFLEPGTGEAIVAESLKLLDRLHDDTATP